MTRVPRDANGKPLPTPPREDDLFEEPTVKTAVPSKEELEAHLYQVGGGAYERDRRPL
jgi:hypothetical protein